MKLLESSDDITHVVVGVRCHACDANGCQTWREEDSRTKSREVSGKCRECGGTKIVPKMMSYDWFRSILGIPEEGSI